MNIPNYLLPLDRTYISYLIWSPTPFLLLCPFRIVLSKIQFGAVGTVVSTVAFGPEVSLPFLAGSLSGALYLYLLGKKTDSIGSGKRIRKGKSSSKSRRERERNWEW